MKEVCPVSINPSLAVTTPSAASEAAL